ncbi:hypothetical protein KR222_001805, partial [Zaprionus bogoriensis]
VFTVHKVNRMDSCGLYKGHSIFRNQPSYRTFNKSLEHADDTLFTFLNEVDEQILNEELATPSNVFASYTCKFSRRDPRNQQVVASQVCDYTTEGLPYAFPNPQDHHSVLGRAQQAACLRVLLAWQRGSIVNKEDFVVWHATSNKRINEQQLVQKHIYEYANSQKERLFAPMKPLAMHYSTWFQLKMKHLLQTMPALSSSYATHSGLPQLPQCKSLNSQVVSMEHVQLLSRAGQVRLWPNASLRQNDLSTLRVRLERYVCVEDADDANKESIANDLEQQLQQADEDVYVLPVESLLMLILPGAYIDLPTEMMLHIRDIPESEYKCVEFHAPLPARHCGWHTNSRILTQAYAAFTTDRWLRCAPATPDKRTARRQQLPPSEYKLHPIDEQSEILGSQRSNCALVSWRLQAEAEPGLQMYSTLSIPAVSDESTQRPVGCHFIKLESKPECGCEIMTKYELLSAWLQLRLLGADVGHCTRVALQDFTLLLEEQLNLETLEKQLHEYYHISMPQQLSQLHEFLKLLRGIAPGEYLLRYTTKYKDKFLLCRPTLETTAQSFKLQELLCGMPPPNEVNFLTNGSNYLPVSLTLCSRLHEQLQLLPCAFPAMEKGVRKSSKQQTKPDKPAQKLVQRTRTRVKPKATKKNQKKNLKRQRKRAAAKAQQEQDKELDKIMVL